jgi:hypothetical protein
MPKVTERGRCGNQSRVTNSPSKVSNPISVGIVPFNALPQNDRVAAQTVQTNH